MSTLPFLLSVADELDNIHSQSYMDDFGLGFHPHRQYYRSPSIQLSLPANTDWMEQKRSRCPKFVDVSEFEEGDNDDDEDNNDEARQARKQSSDDSFMDRSEDDGKDEYPLDYTSVSRKCRKYNKVPNGSTSSSSEEILSEPSSIEFLTCFPSKKSKLLRSITNRK